MNTGSALCDFCIDVMKWWAAHTPLTYGDINVLLFIVLNPLLTLTFMITTLVLAVARVGAKTRRVLVCGTVVTLVLSILFVGLLLAVPLFAS